MLDELFPIQFVEGLNEGAEPSEEDSIVITRYSGFGIQYIPSLSYSLTGLEMMLVFGDFREGTQISVEISSDYNEKPSDIILSSGSFVPKVVYGEWREVTLKPVSVIRNKKYWVIVHPNGCPTSFVKADKGKGYILSGKRDAKWRTPLDSLKEGEVMLKFYGRILPISVC